LQGHCAGATDDAFVDYLIPFPTTGGMLHVMTLVPAAGLVSLRSTGVEPFSTLADDAGFSAIASQRMCSAFAR